MIITNTSFAQSRTSMMGPKAKSYKPWENKSTVAYPISQLAEPNIKEFGGKAKNKKHVFDADKAIVIQNQSKRTQLMGPKAKNHKIWED